MPTIKKVSITLYVEENEVESVKENAEEFFLDAPVPLVRPANYIRVEDVPATEMTPELQQIFDDTFSEVD